MARLLLLAVATALVCGVVPVAPAVADVTPTYYTLPTGYGASGTIATAPNGDVWLGVSKNDFRVATVARLRPSEASAGTSSGIATFPTPTPGSPTCCVNAVRSVAFDGVNNRLWFAQSDGIVGMADARSVVPGTTNSMTATRLAGSQDLHDVAVRPDGSSWITEYSASNIGPNYYGNRIALVSPTPDNQLQVNEFDNLALQGHGPPLDNAHYDAKPDGITVDASGAPWFAESEAGTPGYRIATGQNGSYTEYLVQPCGSGPMPTCSGSYSGDGVTDVAVAPDGSKWFTNQLKNQIGRLDTSGGTFSNYDLSTIDPTLANGVPVAITAAPDGTLWVADPRAHAIIRIVPSQPTPTATVYHVGANTPGDVAADSTGDVWFPVGTPSGIDAVGELVGVVGTAPPGGGSTGAPPGGGSTGGGGPFPGGGSSGGAFNPAPTSSPVGGPQPVALTPASTAVATISAPTTSGPTVTLDVTCAGRDANGVCQVVYIISSREYINAFPGARTSKARKAIVFRRQTVTIPGGSRKKVRITLNAKGRKLLQAQGRLSVFFSATQAASGTNGPRLLKRLRLTLRRGKH